MANSLFEFGLRWLVAKTVGDPAKLRLGAGSGDERRHRAAHHVSAQEQAVGSSGGRRLDRRDAGGFLGRKGFAGQRRLVHVRFTGLEHPAVTGNAVTRVERHDITRHDLLDSDFDRLAIAQHVHGHAHHRE